MTIKQLRQKLCKYPESMRVMIKRIDECGLEDMQIIGVRRVKYDDTPKKDCCHNHEEHPEGEETLIICCV